MPEPNINQLNLALFIAFVDGDPRPRSTTISSLHDGGHSCATRHTLHGSPCEAQSTWCIPHFDLITEIE